MKVALVYDRVNKWGGAERVLLILHEMFPEAPLYTSVYNSETAPWARVFPRIHTSFLQKIPFLRDRHEFLGTFMPLAFESFNFSGYDLVISVTSEAAKGIITRPPTKHLCFMLTPTRYLWSHHNQYFKGAVFKTISKPAVEYLRYWDKIAGQRPDVIIAISTAVRERIKKYYERDSEVIFPPVETKRFKIYDLRFKKQYFLIVSRLVSYKRIDLAIEAFNKLGYPLVIVGTGNQAQSLKLKAKKNIKFVGQVNDAELKKYYQGAKALIMPQEEDFGITVVEAQAAGCPVIAYGRGGVLDTVKEGKTGVIFEEQVLDSLVDAVERFARMEFNPKYLISNAEKFSKERFKKEFLKLIADVGI